jgi:hypothetical protein
MKWPPAQDDQGAERRAPPWCVIAPALIDLTLTAQRRQAPASIASLAARSAFPGLGGNTAT